MLLFIVWPLAIGVYGPFGILPFAMIVALIACTIYAVRSGPRDT